MTVSGTTFRSARPSGAWSVRGTDRFDTAQRRIKGHLSSCACKRPEGDCVDTPSRPFDSAPRKAGQTLRMFDCRPGLWNTITSLNMTQLRSRPAPRPWALDGHVPAAPPDRMATKDVDSCLAERPSRHLCEPGKEKRRAKGNLVGSVNEIAGVTRSAMGEAVNGTDSPPTTEAKARRIDVRDQRNSPSDMEGRVN